MRRLFSLFPVFALSLTAASAQLATPAPMNGIWKLTGITDASAGDAALPLPRPGGQLVISGDALRVTSSCARIEGQIQAGAGRVQITARSLPLAANAVCRFAVDGNVLDVLNSASSYVLNRDHLILFSRGSRLAFERIGFVTPVKH